MKLVALRIRPIAKVGAAIYAVLGASFWIAYCFGEGRYLTIPVGLVAPLVHFNLNFHFQRTQAPVYNVLLFLASVLGYALTGWMTAMSAVICFNVAARLKGGIDADFICFRENQHAEIAEGVEETPAG